MEVDGRLYVDLESLARIANGTLGFSGNQITLTLPSSAAGTESAAAPSRPPANSGFSKEFLRASIEEMAVIREWRSALVNSIENNFPIQEDWWSVTAARPPPASDWRPWPPPPIRIEAQFSC